VLALVGALVGALFGALAGACSGSGACSVGARVAPLAAAVAAFAATIALPLRAALVAGLVTLAGAGAGRPDEGEEDLHLGGGSGWRVGAGCFPCALGGCAGICLGRGGVRP